MRGNNPTVFSYLRGLLVRGVLFIAPVWLSIFLIDLVYKICESALGSLTAQVVSWLLPASWLTGSWAGGHIPGLSLVTALMLLGLLGFIASWKVGAAGLRLVDYLFLAIPGLSTVYSAARKLIDALGEPGKSRFQKVVLIEWPVPAIRTIGFVTNEVNGDDGEKYYWVFIPHMPNPTSGYVMVVKAKEVMETDMTTEQGLKLCMSLGVLAPPNMAVRKE